MAANFMNSVRMARPTSSSFDLSHDIKLSLNMGELVPINTMEVIPGDSFRVGVESLLRLAPMLAPIMHKVDVFTHTFFVPNRLVWSNWEKFITGDRDGTAPGPAAPFFANVTANPGSLADYLGLPNQGVLDKVSAIPFAAYQMIWNEYYRDENLQTPIDYRLVDGDSGPISDFATLRNRAWNHDMFTSNLPFAQKGSAVDIPIGGYLPIVLNSFGGAYPGQTAVQLNPADPSVGGPATPMLLPSTAPISLGWDIKDIGAPIAGAMYADGTQAEGGVTINELRKAFRLQEWLEKNARGGTRYIEQILAHFGVKSSDSRLNRPEYLGGSKQPMVISEVLQTSETDTTPQANMSGHGVSVGAGRQFKYFAEEHGYVMTIMSIMPKTAYQQGIPKHFSKFDRLDYAWPTFAHLGETAVKNRELYYSASDGLNDDTFGYLPIYYEYRTLPGRVAGDFRTSLSYWHMGRIFGSRPALNASFIVADPTHRIFAVTDPAVDKVYAHVFFQIRVNRKLPQYGTPTF